LLGIYFTSHPMQNIAEMLNRLKISTLGKVDLIDGQDVAVGCLISSIKKISTKSGDAMAFLTLEDTYKTIEAVLFPRDFLKYKDILKAGDVALVKGKCNMRNGEMTLIVNMVKVIADDSENADVLEIEIPNIVKTEVATLEIISDATSNDLEQLRDLLFENPGNVEVVLNIPSGGKIRKFKMKKKVKKEIILNLVSKMPLVLGINWA